jgi:hydrogenase nickel incorporation protein HypB
MCATCGCGSGSNTAIHQYGDQHVHEQHSHEHTHPQQKTIVDVEKDVLQQNNLLAERNRGYFEAKNILGTKPCEFPRFGKNHFTGKNT